MNFSLDDSCFIIDEPFVLHLLKDCCVYPISLKK